MSNNEFNNLAEDMGGLSMATHGIYNGITGISEELMDKYKMYVAPEFQRNSDLVPISKVDGQIYEYACHEGNHGMVNILRGERMAEQVK